MFSTRSLLPLGFTLLSSVVTSNAYTLVHTYDATNFFNDFSLFTQPDPTSGFVKYVSQQVASNNHLINTDNNQVYLGVDTTTYNPAGGRESVRLTTNAAYGQGLFIADISHMPTGCGVWPAFWMFGPNWPYSGEIDIIEGVNNQPTNTITLHTGPGCTIANPNSQFGTNTMSTNCNADNAYQGCSVSTGNSNNFGQGFNNNGGGTYAMQWASSGIYVWFWQRGQVPGDILAEQPNTWAWGQPLATFEGAGEGCDFNSAFREQNLVFDTTFCGAWAGTQWWNSGCAAQTGYGSCNQYVAENPGAFMEAFWTVESVKVYQ